MAFGITGTAIASIGFGLLALAALSGCSVDCSGHDTNQNDASRGTMAGIGLGALAVGAVMTPLGWSAYARNRKPALESSAPPGYGRRPAPRTFIGVSPLRRGGAIDVGLRF